MKLHRFIGDFNLHHARVSLHDKEVIFQILEILKIQVGEKVILSNGNGEEALAKLEGHHKGSLEFLVEEVYTNTHEPQTQVILYAAILKSDHFEFIAQKCTEVGVAQIIPIITKRTVKLNLRHDRIQKIMKEAAEQSGRAIVPALGMPLSFDEALTLAKNHEKNFFFDMNATVDLRTEKQNCASAGIFIGPEGGWDPGEQSQALEAGCTIASLGPLTFRAETAAVVATYLLAC